MVEEYVVLASWGVLAWARSLRIVLTSYHFPKNHFLINISNPRPNVPQSVNHMPLSLASFDPHVLSTVMNPARSARPTLHVQKPFRELAVH